MGSSSQILSNGYISSPFPILQGTQQGCPLSPLLFACAIEPFQGINTGEREVKLSMFADYMLLFISKPVESLNTIITTLDQFSAFAGFRVNYSKSNLLPLSLDFSFFTSHPALTKFTLCSSQLKYLGVYIPIKILLLYQVNFKPIIKSMEKSLLICKGLPF